jgi:alcohol dehydrogenase, propanol-preferring
MRAARLHRAGEPPVLEEVPLPEPTGTEVRIRVAGCGVCRTDLQLVAGTQVRSRLPVTLGHEVAGWIDAWGPDARPLLQRGHLASGAAVVVHGGWGCGECPDCRSGDEQRCVTGTAPGFQADGGYAEAMLVPHPRHLVGLGTLDPLRAAPLADAGVTPYRAVERASRWLEPGTRVLIIGFGGLGQFLLQYLRQLPELRIAVRELDPQKVAKATAAGADIGLLDGDAALVRDGLGGSPAVVFDVVGTDGTLSLAADLVAPDGLVMLVGEAGGHIGLGFDRPAVEAWITTTAWGSLDDLRAVVRLASRGALDWTVEPVPLADIATAHRRLAEGALTATRLVLVP